MHKQATVRTPFPKAKKVARTLGVSKVRTEKIVKLMDTIAVTDHISITPRTGKLHAETHKPHVSIKKKK